MSLIDKRSIMQVLGNVMKKPSLLEEERYRLTKEDFYVEGESSFYMIIFAAINNLKEQGIDEIDLLMVDSFLSSYEIQYKTFNDNDGIEYLHTALENAHIRNFDYSFTRLKKFSLLREYERQGFDIKGVYDDSVINPVEKEKMVEEFDRITIEEIIEIFERKQLDIRNMFLTDNSKKTQHAAKGAKALVESYKAEPDFGVSLIGNLQNTIFRGAKLKTVTLRSAPQNTGKTRLALAEATDLAVDEIYDLKLGKWIERNNLEDVLYISTEMDADLLQPTILAYISGVPESSIKDGICTDEEYERVDKAIEVLGRSNLWIEYIPNFNTQLIETVIKTHIVENKTQYIFFDYIHISVQILEEMANMSKGMSMREDMVLYMFMFRLVEIAERYNVFISTSSQLNGEWKNVRDGDQNLLRGAKSLADKIQKAMIAFEVTQKDLESIEPILRNGFYKTPNIVYHVYKNRMTKYKPVKIWLHVDYDTMRIDECFVTKNDCTLIEDIEPTEIKSKPKQKDDTKFVF
ncbi:hypothetical protein LCM23_13075 [Cytobacillus kochii]|uniref:DnaB-like helicase C-terminal domain-containing protein n=1 Tax=Cytobacillus kochii TaxID=859143 RepID=UPI001CD57E8F|nr:DnaB-like helicase C-terminal domain-containing protein [Cytobacillus kochii]MCA1027027.1 hypothetical protein [Cytobacillus kochii]